MTALAVLYSLPVVVATLLFQRKIVSGLTLGAVKVRTYLLLARMEN